MIAVIDYKCGNLRSVGNALQRIGCDYRITGDEAVIRSASHVILPGVGAASATMVTLKRSGMDKLIVSLTQPVLGICLGMQIMCRFSEEGNIPCLGLFDTTVRKIHVSEELKVPHMGWNTISQFTSSLTDGVSEGAYVYYVHSFAPERCRHTIAITDYGTIFSAILRNRNFFGTQFHPEKSGAVGETLLTNFLNHD
jgi:glutamine amidotransferase